MMRFNLNFCQSFHSDFVLDATLAKSFSLAPQRAKGIHFSKLPRRRRVRASERALLFRSSKTLKRQNYKEALISVGKRETDTVWSTRGKEELNCPDFFKTLNSFFFSLGTENPFWRKNSSKMGPWKRSRILLASEKNNSLSRRIERIVIAHQRTARACACILYAHTHAQKKWKERTQQRVVWEFLAA
jgi:hypothetical protein